MVFSTTWVIIHAWVYYYVVLVIFIGITWPFWVNFCFFVSFFTLDLGPYERLNKQLLNRLQITVRVKKKKSIFLHSWKYAVCKLQTALKIHRLNKDIGPAGPSSAGHLQFRRWFMCESVCWSTFRLKNKRGWKSKDWESERGLDWEAAVWVHKLLLLNIWIYQNCLGSKWTSGNFLPSKLWQLLQIISVMC